MKSEFSEFTYGFALVNELTKVLSCTAVPLFPSLREEGMTGGGYDTCITLKKGTILYLQFKLSEYLIQKNAREFKIPGHSLNLPYYRFEITSKRISKQHSLLQKLEVSNSLTFYAAPAFHLREEIDENWNNANVTKHSVFVKPSSIGDLSDNNTHRIGFDESSIKKNQAYLFSDPKILEINNFDSFSEIVISQIDEEETLACSIERILKSFASVIEPIEDSPALQRTPKISDERDLLLQKRIYNKVRRLIEESRHSSKGADLLRLFAEFSTFIGGVQAVAVVQEES